MSASDHYRCRSCGWQGEWWQVHKDCPVCCGRARPGGADTTGFPGLAYFAAMFGLDATLCGVLALVCVCEGWYEKCVGYLVAQLVLEAIALLFLGVWLWYARKP